MNRAILSLAANTPDKQEQMSRAIEELRIIIPTFSISTAYETEAVGYRVQPPYLNAVAIADTPLTHDELQARLKELEHRHGRTPQSKAQGAIPLDIDIVVWNGEVLRPRDHKQPYFTIGLNELQQTL